MFSYRRWRQESARVASLAGSQSSSVRSGTRRCRPHSGRGPVPGGCAPRDRAAAQGPALSRMAVPADCRYLTAPAVRPATTCRWKMMYAASTGSIAITRPAKRPDQSPL